VTDFNPINKIWTEKYRPKDVTEIVGDFRNNVLNILNTPNQIPHLLLHSKSPGTGKTSLAKIIIKTLGSDYLIINSSDDRKIDTVRGKVKEFAETQSTTPGVRRVIFLDEIDGMLKASQEALRNIMETYASNVLFILTCNSINKIHEAIISRCLAIEFQHPKKDEIKEYLIKICKSEKLEYSDDGIKEIISKHYPNIRNCVIALQKLKLDNLKVSPEHVSAFNPLFEKLWNTIHTDKDWKSVRQTILSTNLNAREFNKYLWNKAIELDNIKLIQLTCQNELHMSYGADANIMLTTSLIEMIK
tara:strand:- start:1904 stop:2809 length:906 start_codon:yes stop_codon:yes gene_type:complete